MAGKNTADIGFEKQIWDAACVLRGNMDASEYKNVVLGLIFLKYISDRFDEKYQALVEEGDGFEEDIDEYTSEGIFFVPAGANKDHKCDICDYIISECADDNKDHKCDYCGKKLTEHTGGKATCKDKAKCEVCGAEYGELDPKNHTNLKHFPAKAATKDAEGNIEYWYCDGCGKYFSDKDGTKEIKKADTVTAKLKDDSKSPQTGDTSNLALWIALLFVSGGAAIGTTIVSRKKKYNK